MKKQNESARLSKLRARTPDFIAEKVKTKSPFVLLFQRHDREAHLAFARAKTIYGHDSWQAAQAFAGRAIATSRASKGDRDRIRAIRDIGQYVEGGSIEGHTHALHALLGRYDRLEDWPPWPTPSEESIDSDLARRLADRNKLLRTGVRSTCDVRLALLSGGKPRAKDYKNENTDHALAGEAALAVGDLVHAEERFWKVATDSPSFMTDMSHGDPRVVGFIGLARVVRARKIHALVFKHVESALAIDKTNAKALLLGMATAESVGLRARALAYRTKLRQTHPLADTRLDDLLRSEVEARLGTLLPAFVSHQNLEKAIAARDFTAVIAASERLLVDGTNTKNLNTPAASAFLFALAENNDFERLEHEATRFLSFTPFFISAREARAFALGRLGKARLAAEKDFALTGLAVLFRKWTANDDEPRLDLQTWSKRSPAEALSPRPTDALERAQALFMKGATDDALAVLGGAGSVPKDDHETRWLAAGSCFRRGVLRSPAEKKKAAREAWTWIEPLTKKGKLDEKHPRAMAIVMSAIEIAHALGDPERVLSVRVPYEATAYRSLTGRAHAYVAPLIADSLIAVGRPKQAVAMIETIWSDDEGERLNARLIEAFDRARKRLTKREKAKAKAKAKAPPPTAEERRRAHVFADEIFMRLTDEAWAHEERRAQAKSPGIEKAIEKAIATYLLAAEAEPERSSIGLGNAGNLLTHRGEYARAWRFLSVALTNVSGLPPSSRAPVLSQVAHHFRVQDRHADALPSAALAFDFEPTAERAAILSLLYVALGNRERGQHFSKIAERLEARHRT